MYRATGPACCFASGGESERRPRSLDTRKITRPATAIKLGLKQKTILGDLGSIRDWSFAGDVMFGAWLILQQDEPDDYVLASGVGNVEEFANAAFAGAGLNASDYILVDPVLTRVVEATASVGIRAGALASRLAANGVFRAVSRANGRRRPSRTGRLTVQWNAAGIRTAY